MRVLQKGHIFLVIALFECRLCKGPSRLKLQGWVARVRCRCVPNCEHWEMSVGISAWSNVIEVNFVLKFKDDVSSNIIQCVPLATEPGISLIILTPMKILQRNLNRSTFVVWEMKRSVSVVCVCSAPNCCDTEQLYASQPGSVASGTPYIRWKYNNLGRFSNCYCRGENSNSRWKTFPSAI